METAGDGSIQPGLSVLLRGNATGTPFNRLSVDTTDTASGQSDVNRDTTGRIERGGSGGAAEAEGDIGRVRDGGAKMLDLVTEHPSGCTVNDRVISEPCNIRRSPSNGFTGSNQAERAGTDGTECHPVPGTGEMMNEPGKAFHALSLSEQIMDVSADEPCALNSRTMSHPVDPPALSPNGRHENSRFTGIAVPSRSDYDGLLNGEADTGAQSPPGADTGRASQSERHTEAKMSNGGLSPGHSDSPYRMSGVNTRASLSHLQNPPSSSPPSSSSSTAMGGLSQDSGRAIGERDRTEGNRSGTREENTVGENPSPGSGLITSRGSPLGPRGQATPSPAGAAASPDPATTRQAGDDGASDPGLSLEPSPGPSPRGDGDGEARSGTGGFSDVSLDSRNTYESSRRQSAPGHLPPGLDAADPSEPEPQSKRPGIAEYFGRSLFSKRQREHSAPGWKLFGKVPLRESPSRDSRTIQQEYEAKQAKPGNSPTHNAQGRSRRNLEFEPLSTTALILEDRPANLPAKSVEEAQRHRQEYEEMVAEARKRELREAQRKQRQMKERIRQEDSIASAMLVWNNDILPHWDSARNSRRARDLWWQGLPPNVRGRVWSLAIANELNITPELYEIFLSRAREKWRIFSETGSESEADDGASLADRESSLDLIKLDISRTFPSLFIFQKGGPYHDVLHSVLGAYTCYRPDVGYVQGMSFIAAVLILNLEEADAFIAFANLLNKPCQLAFFRVDHDLMLKYFAAFEVFFEENLPRLFNHFQSHNLTPDLYLIDWIFTLYSKSLALDVACRVWDVFCRDGEEFLFQTGLGILRLYEDVLLQMDFIHIAQFLTRLPDHVPSDRLFSCIAATPMVSGNRRWTQVFNALIKDNKENGKE